MLQDGVTEAEAQALALHVQQTISTRLSQGSNGDGWHNSVKGYARPHVGNTQGNMVTRQLCCTAAFLHGLILQSRFLEKRH